MIAVQRQKNKTVTLPSLSIQPSTAESAEKRRDRRGRADTSPTPPVIPRRSEAECGGPRNTEHQTGPLAFLGGPNKSGHDAWERAGALLRDLCFPLRSLR